MRKNLYQLSLLFSPFELLSFVCLIWEALSAPSSVLYLPRYVPPNRVVQITATVMHTTIVTDYLTEGVVQARIMDVEAAPAAAVLHT